MCAQQAAISFYALTAPQEIIIKPQRDGEPQPEVRAFVKQYYDALGLLISEAKDPERQERLMLDAAHKVRGLLTAFGGPFFGGGGNDDAHEKYDIPRREPTVSHRSFMQRVLIETVVMSLRAGDENFLAFFQEFCLKLGNPSNYPDYLSALSSFFLPYGNSRRALLNNATYFLRSGRPINQRRLEKIKSKGDLAFAVLSGQVRKIARSGEAVKPETITVNGVRHKIDSMDELNSRGE